MAKKILQKKKTLVLGASTNPERFSYKAIERLLEAGHPVVAIGAKAGWIGKTEILTETRPLTDIHTVSIYLAPQQQQFYYNYIISLAPERVIFNPCTENPVFFELLDRMGIAYEAACNLVLLSLGQY